jgi:hypothetical protein
MSAITPDLAKRLRYERGLMLPEGAEYSAPRLKEIAVRQRELFEEIQKLDEEIKQLAEDVDANKVV